MKPTAISTRLLALAAAALVAAPVAAKKYPDTTVEGLVRINDTKMQAVYAEPDADLTGYQRIWLETPEVQFKKNWLRDQNRGVRSASGRVNESDMQKIRDGLADMFMEVFTAELSEGGYELVDAPADDVLRIKPEIVDLDVYAPDVGMSTRSNTYAESAGEMTLNLELYDSITGDLIARGIDRRKDPQQGYMQWQTSIANKSAADRILKDWAKTLHEGLDETMAVKPQ